MLIISTERIALLTNAYILTNALSNVDFTSTQDEIIECQFNLKFRNLKMRIIRYTIVVPQICTFKVLF